jgi:hypothetical protein
MFYILALHYTILRVEKKRIGGGGEYESGQDKPAPIVAFYKSVIAYVFFLKPSIRLM